MFWAKFKRLFLAGACVGLMGGMPIMGASSLTLLTNTPVGAGTTLSNAATYINANFLLQSNQIATVTSNKIENDSGTATNLTVRGLTESALSTARLIEIVSSDGYQFLTSTFDGNGILTNALVLWPDGTHGVFSG